VCFSVSLDHFGFVLLASFVGYCFFSVPSQEIGWEERLRNDPFCVDWDVTACLIRPPVGRATGLCHAGDVNRKPSSRLADPAARCNVLYSSVHR